MGGTCELKNLDFFLFFCVNWDVTRRVNNRVSTKERATMRCFCQLRMTPAPLMMKGFRQPTHPPRRRIRTWMWTSEADSNDDDLC